MEPRNPEDTLPIAMLNGWLADAFSTRPGWTVRRRAGTHSFQQWIERVTLEWPDTNHTEDVFVRVYESYLSWWNIEARDLPQRERAALLAAQAVGLPTPPLLHFATAPDRMILGAMPGQSRRMPTTPEDVEKVARAMALLHRAPIGSEQKQFLPDVTLGVLLDRFEQWAGDVGDACLRCEVDALRERCGDEVHERPPVVLHGDWHTGNYLVDDAGNLTAVLDWEEAALGDPRIDVVHLYGSIRRGGASEALTTHLLTTYEALAGFAVGPMAFWEDLLGLRRRILSAWFKQALADNRPLPARDPSVWLNA